MADASHHTARQIRAARAYANMSRLKLGRAIGVSDETIGRWERGDWKKDAPRLPMLEKIAQVTEVPDVWVAAGFLSEADEISPLEALVRVQELLSRLSSEPGDTQPERRPDQDDSEAGG